MDSVKVLNSNRKTFVLVKHAYNSLFCTKLTVLVFNVSLGHRHYVVTKSGAHCDKRETKYSLYERKLKN